MKLTILGCHAATPRTLTNPTAQVLEVGKHFFLIDCGEATQVQLRKQKVKFGKINRIFISHLHGDHVFGLIGLVSTFMLLGRKDPLHIYGPKGIRDLILIQLRITEAWCSYELNFHELESKESEMIYENDQVEVFTIPLKHRVYTNGFLFREKPGLRKLNREAAESHNVESVYYHKAVTGKDVVDRDGNVVKSEWITYPPRKIKSYAYCSDTAYTESILPYINEVDALYHESTFLESESELAAITQHSTAQEAARIASNANVGRLILGHYSTRYSNLDDFQKEAQTVFVNTELAEDGKIFEI